MSHSFLLRSAVLVSILVGGCSEPMSAPGQSTEDLAAGATRVFAGSNVQARWATRHAAVDLTLRCGAVVVARQGGLPASGEAELQVPVDTPMLGESCRLEVTPDGGGEATIVGRVRLVALSRIAQRENGVRLVRLAADGTETMVGEPVGIRAPSGLVSEPATHRLWTAMPSLASTTLMAVDARDGRVVRTLSTSAGFFLSRIDVERGALIGYRPRSSGTDVDGRGLDLVAVDTRTGATTELASIPEICRVVGRPAYRTIEREEILLGQPCGSDGLKLWAIPAGGGHDRRSVDVFNGGQTVFDVVAPRSRNDIVFSVGGATPDAPGARLMRLDPVTGLTNVLTPLPELSSLYLRFIDDPEAEALLLLGRHEASGDGRQLTIDARTGGVLADDRDFAGGEPAVIAD